MRIRFLTIVCPAIRQRTKTLLRMTAALAFLGVQASEAGLVQGVQGVRDVAGALLGFELVA